MANSGNRPPNFWTEKLLIPVVAGILIAGTIPWWLKPITNIFKGLGLPGLGSNAPIEKLDVSSVDVNNGNEYSSGYTAENITDGNNQSYWSTKRGSVFDVVLDFYFDEPKSLSQIEVYPLDHGSDYTQPIEVELIFLNDSGEIITSQTVTMKGSLDKWQEYDLKKVDNVSRVTMDLKEPKNNTASYITFNEIRFYGYD